MPHESTRGCTDRRHREVAEQHREDEHVVERQRALEQVAGEILRARVAALPSPTSGLRSRARPRATPPTRAPTRARSPRARRERTRTGRRAASGPPARRGPPRRPSRRSSRVRRSCRRQRQSGRDNDSFSFVRTRRRFGSPWGPTLPGLLETVLTTALVGSYFPSRPRIGHAEPERHRPAGAAPRAVASGHARRLRPLVRRRSTRPRWSRSATAPSPRRPTAGSCRGPRGVAEPPRRLVGPRRRPGGEPAADDPRLRRRGRRPGWA